MLALPARKTAVTVICNTKKDKASSLTDLGACGLGKSAELMRINRIDWPARGRGPGVTRRPARCSSRVRRTSIVARPPSRRYLAFRSQQKRAYNAPYSCQFIGLRRRRLPCSLFYACPDVCRGRLVSELSSYFLQGDVEQGVDFLEFSTIFLAGDVTPQLFENLRDMPHWSAFRRSTRWWALRSHR